MNNTFQLNFLL